MPATITISTHNGSTVSIGHNLRIPEIIKKENEKYSIRHPGELRIDLSKKHIIYKYEPLKEVYHKLFDEAQAEYNKRQIQNGHPERQIKDYYSHLRSHEGKNKKSKHVIYEIIYTVGSKDNPVDEPEAKAILEEMVKNFETRNPQFYVVCCVGHYDETGQAHIHLDYLPVADNCSRGMKTQNALKESLRQMGIEGTGFKDTAQMRWEKRENQALEEICNRHGYTVIHPQAGSKTEHLTVEEYKLTQEIKEKQQEINNLNNLPLGKTIITKARLEQLENTESEYISRLPELEQAKHDLTASRNAFEAYSKKFEQLENNKNAFEEKVNKAANQKVTLLKKELEQAIDFIKSLGLIEKFERFKKTASKILHR